MYRDSRLGLCLDLSGPEGNVFCLLGIAQDLARQLKMNPERVIEILKQHGDKDGYEGVVRKFEEFFPVVTLINKPGECDADIR